MDRPMPKCPDPPAVIFYEDHNTHLYERCTGRVVWRVVDDHLAPFHEGTAPTAPDNAWGPSGPAWPASIEQAPDAHLDDVGD